MTEEQDWGSTSEAHNQAMYNERRMRPAGPLRRLAVLLVDKIAPHELAVISSVLSAQLHKICMQWWI